MERNHVNTRRDRIVSIAALTAALLASVSVIAQSAGRVQAQTVSAGASQTSFTKDSSGGDGTNGDDSVFSSTYPTSGGNGGDITLTNDGTIGPTSDGSSVISLTSDGGRGGNADGYYGNTDYAAGVGGDGGSITVTNNGTIGSTYLTGAKVIVISSTGGDGGDGVNAFWGANGGDGGSLSMTNTGTLDFGYASSLADEEYSITLTTTGGKGGDVEATSLDDASGYTAGQGGKGGSITFVNGASFTTQQMFGQVVYLRSTGGAGGDPAKYATPSKGGDGGDITVTISADIIAPRLVTSVVDAVSTGGRSGMFAGFGTTQSRDDIAQTTGGTGGKVSITVGSGVTVSSGAVATTDSPADVIVAKSVGGDGGDGQGETDYFSFQNNPAWANFGGSGGTADITVNGTITSTGPSVFGVQSVAQGGTGGVGGASYAFLQAARRGGDGGYGGVASATVSAEGKVSTTGDDAAAVVVQALGGDGGTGGQSHDASETSGDGGDGGGFNDSVGAESVQFTNNGTVSTAGDRAPALVLQSVGGDGGDGGDGGSGDGGYGGGAGMVAATNNGVITTGGQYAFGVFAQSVGGTGGTGTDGSFLNFGGGDGGGAGGGGSVDFHNVGSITTTGTGAAGIVAQSVGGGNALAAYESADLVFSAVNDDPDAEAGGDSDWFFAARGGDGGSGGDGGDVTINNDGTISTTGQEAIGVFAQSVGGGGGRGGDADSAAAGFSVSVGGTGGSGGDGGKVTVGSLTNGGSITTTGLSAPGVMAMSVGGSGGVGGSASSDSASLVVGWSLAIGGGGGDGGDADTITIANKSAITTSSIDSPGITAMSVGGGGGRAGQASAEATTLGGGDLPSVALTYAVGGSGGYGGDGGEIDVTNNGVIQTGDDQSYGIMGMSVGGGGGNGANATAASHPYAFGEDSAAIGVSAAIGGSGEYGGVGGDVTVRNHAAVTTGGSGSIGIVAMSIGGGGGDGGQGRAEVGTAIPEELAPLVNTSQSYTAKIAIGGSGGSGQDGGAITVENDAAITTTGADSQAIFGFSVGGGGGNGNGGTAGGSGKMSVSVAIGGGGDGGGDGGDVKLTNDTGGVILTSGDGAHGVQAMSVGGGGGSGGTASAETEGKGVVGTAWDKYVDQLKEELSGKESEGGGLPSMSANVSIGGSAGEGGAGGAITLTNDGSVTTNGNVAFGMFAQSVGGGGGSGGAASTASGNLVNATVTIGGDGGGGGDGGTVTATNTGAIGTSASNAFGIFAQSVGAGGGMGGVSGSKNAPSITANVTIGGDGSASGDGGGVTVTNDGTITTGGSDAHGVLAQSVGGGGGLMFLNFDEDSTDGDSSDDSDDLEGPSLTLSISGTEGSAGDGGKLTIDHNGAITTTGSAAFGIFAQSVGGGGGAAADGDLRTDTLVSGAIGGGTGNAGDGGEVDVVLGDGSSITTNAGAAIGVFAQSVGGGGGYTGSVDRGDQTDSLFTFSDGGSSGDGGAISITSDRSGSGAASVSITTRGDRAHAIFAQSVGGGGGAIADSLGISIGDGTGATTRTGSSGTGGAITVNTVGTITTAGADAHAIYAQSGRQRSDGSADPTVSGGDITITHSGTITGGSGSGVGIHIDGGAVNTITLSDSTSTLSALSGTAIKATFGDDTVYNSGTIAGDVALGDGSNSFVNESTGSYVAYSSIELGTSGVLTNKGAFHIAKSGTIGTTAMTGKFAQTSSGTLHVDADFQTASADRLEVDGSASLDGAVAVNLTTPPPSGSSSAVTIVTASSVTGSLTATDTLVVDYDATVGTGDVTLAIKSADFGKPASSMSTNRKALAEHFQELWRDSGTDEVQTVLTELANASSSSAYQTILDQHSGEAHAVGPSTVTATTHTALNTAMSCPRFVGGGVALREQSCFWTSPMVYRGRHFADDSVSKYKTTTLGDQIGGQIALSDDWVIGGLITYGHTRLRTDGGTVSSVGDTLDISVVTKRHIGQWLLAAAVQYGRSWSDLQREVALTTGTFTAKSAPEYERYAGRLRASYHIERESWYLKPTVDLDVIHTRQDGYEETGAGALNMRFDGSTDLQFLITPSIEIGGRVDVSDDWVLRPYTTLGFTFGSDDSWETTAHFTGAAAGSAGFTQSFAVPDRFGRVGVGFSLINTDGLELKAEYDVQFADSFVQNAARMRLGYRF